jgi:hypothetical protein
MHAPSFKSPKWPRSMSVADACDAHAAKLRAAHQDGAAAILPSATVADLIITLERAAQGLR